MEGGKLEELKRNILKKILSKGAMERLARVRLVKPEIASQVELHLLQLYQMGKINREISEEEIKLILEKLSSRGKMKMAR